MRVLVGFDGSDGAWDAIALARDICKLSHGSVLLASAPPDGDAEAEPDFQRPQAALAGIEVDARRLHADSPAHALHDLAEREAVDLVLVGSPHRGAVGRAFLGSVAESLLHGASRPLCVAPRDYASGAATEFGVIGIAYDGGAEAKLALKHAEALAATAGARLRILTVLAPAVPMPGVVGYTPPLGFDPEVLIEEAIAALGPGVETESRRLSGPPAPALAEAAAEGVDLLVVGSRGYGPLGRVFVGSVSSKLIAIAPCPVLVVPRPKEAAVSPAAEPVRQEALDPALEAGGS